MEQNQNVVFQLPKVENIHIVSDTYFAINLSQPMTAPVLKSLIIDSPSSLRLTEQTEQTEDMQRFADKLSQLATLEIVKLPNTNLNNVDFASQLPALTTLDVSGSFIQDVAPLLTLGHLKEVNIFNNPVTNADLLQGVYVIR